MKHKLPILPDDGQTRLWRGEGERTRSAEFLEAQGREFPDGASELNGVTRRSFISLMGATAALAGLTSCRRPEEKILPYAHAPEGVIPGVPRYFATALPFAGTAIGVLVESHENRPTKIEGNPRHPESLGSSNTFIQASVLDLYDPDRSTGPRRAGAPASWADALAALRELRTSAAANGGEGLAILTEGHRSPTLARQLAELRAALPKASIHRYEPLSRDNVREGSRLAFGKPLEPVLALDKARVIVALDADLLATDGSPIRQARGFAQGRIVEKPSDPMNRLYAVESAFSLTGANADHRLRIRSGEVARFTLALARELSNQGLALGEALSAAVATASFDGQQAWLRAVAHDLLSNRGSCVLAAGNAQPPVVHAVVAAINASLGNVGATVQYVRPFDDSPDGAEGIAPLVSKMAAGQVKALLILGGNPVFTAPADLGFASALGKVASSIHLSTDVDETSAACTWHLNRAHALESWSDLRAEDGLASVVQPLIAPIFDGRTDAEVVSSLLGEPKKAYELIRATWNAEHPATFEHAWRKALHDGLWDNSAYPHEAVNVQPNAVADAVKAFKPAPADGLELTFAPCSHTWDGRFANNGWLQETPDPLTKLTWDNAALLSEATAKRLGVSGGDLIDLSVGGATVRVPALLAPGQADESIALALGQGRTRSGRVGQGVGTNVYPLRTRSAMGIAQQARLVKTGGTYPLSITQEHHAMEGRPQIRVGTKEEFARKPDFAKEMVEVPELESVYPDHEYKGHKWGMVIDLNRCIGCNACMVSCQAENNIPIVGKQAVANTREMHWIRVDRYFEGDAANPQALLQPVTCQQCENAPCEAVCPVGATAHSPEGLNDMAYNRCIGTRYCANNCPFKVRRFNFLHYNEGTPELHKMQFNPDVTVRGRGVMEKCTYCVQRINHAKIEAHKQGRERLHDGEVQTACQQACPTRAIQFGDLNDAKSEVAAHAAQERNYALLAELNIRPRTTYLAKVRNPNPALESA